MSKKWGVLLIVLIVLALVGTACDDDEKDTTEVDLKQTLTSSSGITVRYPEGWAAEDSGLSIVIANKEAYLSTTAGSEFPKGAFLVAIFPPMKLDERGLADATVEEALQSVIEGLFAESETFSLGPPVALKGVGEAAVLMGFGDSSNTSEGFVTAIKVDGNTVIVATSAAHYDELTRYNDTARRIVESIRYTASET